ncbi:MAG: hypothetical protein JWQ09_5146 [Segetibacter sp.]|nr:hypothetical protein [Segetibacter sp.]
MDLEKSKTKEYPEREDAQIPEDDVQATYWRILRNKNAKAAFKNQLEKPPITLKAVKGKKEMWILAAPI